ncbi:uncharacterized protein LOC121718467 [Alosa sapidissima]|uniref:uncharacterized protein LOC121718467 n=1 Tax=Alosa sapidissima TaxID=34773 RepID=UPI001C0A3167|nr:uncharacterized protein LOC121718467 [Alosa sapidissima]
MRALSSSALSLKNTKYFCHRHRNITCFNFPTTPQKWRVQTLSNDAFFVTLDQLTAEDAGDYWCGVRETVGESITLISRTQLMIDPPTLPPGAVVAASVNVAVALLLGIPVIIIYMYRRQKVRECSDPSNHRSNITDRDTTDYNQTQFTEVIYEEIKVSRSSRSSYTTPNTVYVMAELPTIPSDDPAYSSGQFPTTPSVDSASCTAGLDPPDDAIYSNSSYLTSETRNAL